MPGMTAGEAKVYYNGSWMPQSTYDRIQQQQSAEAANTAKQEAINKAERERMAMEASRLALENASRLSQTPGTRITTTGNEQTLTNPIATANGQHTWADVPGGGGGSYGSSGSGTGTYGGGTSQPFDTAALDALLQKYAPSPVAAPVLPAQVAAPVAPSSRANAFANAKNISGKQGAAAIRALHDTMSRRGFSDSGLEAEGEAGILGNVATFNSDAGFRADLADDERNWQAAQLGYQGALSQRNADIGAMSTGYQGQISQRAQDLDKLSMILNLSTRRY